tara:strand:+ start:59 stop:997 length:939 start_codon:yes stop_codon:yes gene_type:complete
MANWFSQMFTPQRQGPGQMVWQDIVNEQSGEFSTGDMQEQVWKPSVVGSNYVAGPTTRHKPAQPMQNPQSQEGTGLTAKQDFMAGMDRLENEGMDDSWGASRAQDYGAGPSGSIGASIAESMNPSTMTPGSSRWSGVSMNDNWIQDPYQAPNAFSTGDTDPLKRIRALREHPSDATFYEGSQGIGEQQGQDMMHALALQDDINANSNDAALLPRTGAQLPFGGPTADELDVYDVNSPGAGGQQTEPTAIAQLMKLLGGMVGSGVSGLFTPSQAGAGSPGPTVPNLNPPGPGARFAGPMLDRPGTFGGSRRMY